jgi:hypothetical protein
MFERYRFDKGNKIQSIDLIKKVGFEIFNKVYLSLLISDILINWGFFRALGRENLARF